MRLIFAAMTMMAGMAFAAPAKAGPYEDAVAAFEREDYDAAVVLFRPLAESGHLQAQYYLASIADDRGEIDAALKQFRDLAARGLAAAHYELGLLFESGRGVPRDRAEALKHFRLAANGGDDRAQWELASAYLAEANYDGTTQVFRDGLKWLRLSADQGNIVAMRRLAEIYGLGKGVAVDDVQALTWLAVLTLKNHPSREKELQTALLARMSPAQKQTAFNAARAWRPERRARCIGRCMQVD